MTGRYPEIPNSTAEEQDQLREELLREVRKREASEEANVMEVPPRKIRRVQTELVPQKIIDITGEDDPDKPTVITILPGKDPYDQNRCRRKTPLNIWWETRRNLKYIRTMMRQTTSQS